MHEVMSYTRLFKLGSFLALDQATGAISDVVAHMEFAKLQKDASIGKSGE
jgi:hypothetical protein